MMAKVTVNISNCTSGGGFQISVWFVRKLVERGVHETIDFSYIVNRSHLKQLPPEILRSNLLIVDASPIRSAKSRSEITNFLKRVSPNFVFSTFGPSGIGFKNQISGTANAFITSRSARDIFDIYGFKGAFYYAINLYFGKKIARSRYIVFETENEKENFCSLFMFPRNRTFVIANSVNEIFLTNSPSFPELPLSVGDEIDILVVTSAHRHKNVHLISGYIEAMKNFGFKKFRFLLTISQADYAGMTRQKSRDDLHLRFLGSLTPAELLTAYNRCDLVVHPSALETYSAVFNEVRFAARPLLVSDRPFSRRICGSFATFFEPDNPYHFVATLKDLIAKLPQASKASWDARKEVLLPDQKFEKMIAVIEEAVRLR